MHIDAAIRVRMYRVGFGDCFLLSIPTGVGVEHVLIDCGVHPRGDIGTMEAVVKDIAAETKGKLALVIATHAHADHISGFAAHQDIFRQFQVREVWMPWTENPNDPQAATLKQKHLALVQALTAHFRAKPPSDQAILAALEGLRGNDAALSLLKAGINGGTVSYVEAGVQRDNVAGIAGLSARVLAPPRDSKFLAQMDPPVDERFLRAASGEAVEFFDDESLPFDRTWTVEAAGNLYYSAIDGNEKEKNLLAVDAIDPAMLAFTLDQIVNNTSVVTLFRFGGKTLLFAGDAQYGNWRSWIEKPDAKAQLGELSFYKVAHHGSVNATPKSALAGMPETSFAAMASTQNQPWASIPRLELLTALAAKTSAVVRSDSLHIEGAPEGPVLAQLPEGFQQGALWFDFYLPL